jgi:hypothetical protein
MFGSGMASIGSLWPGRIALFSLLAALLGVTSRPADAGSLIKVWDLDLGKWNSANAGRVPVEALSFSPDGKQIALIGADATGEPGQLVSPLLVVRIGAGIVGIKAFEVPAGVTTPDWSPSGEAIVINSLLVHLDTGVTCRLPNIVRFLSKDQMIGQTREAPPSRASQFSLLDTSCHAIREWKSPEEWYLTDVSIERHLLLMNRPLEENLLVDPDNGSVVRRWSMGTWPVWAGPGGKFANNGIALCNEISLDNAAKGRSFSCWATDTGDLIGYAPADYASSPFAVATKSSRIIFSEYRYKPGLVRDFDSHPYKGAAVWDYLTGEMLAYWQPETQSYFRLGTHQILHGPSQFAISPDGQYVAEGGNGELTVYRIQK